MWPTPRGRLVVMVLLSQSNIWQVKRHLNEGLAPARRLLGGFQRNFVEILLG